MRIRKVDDSTGKAEGLCRGLPYNTELVSINGVTIHFWLADTPSDEVDAKLQAALSAARSARDIVSATYSHGHPDEFWAHENIETP